MIRLASGSPRRRALLALLGAPFEVAPADVDERTAARPALAKAEAVARRGDVTLAADTMIELEGERIGKPEGPAGAVAMLQRLAGRTHVVRTEVALIGAAGQRLHFGVRSTVAMNPADDAAIRSYVATGEPLHKAAPYAPQAAGAPLVPPSHGSSPTPPRPPPSPTFF